MTEQPELTRPSSATPTESQLEHQMPGAIAVVHDPYAALRIGGFWLYEIGWVVSVIGQQVQSVAVQWHIGFAWGSIATPHQQRWAWWALGAGDSRHRAAAAARGSWPIDLIAAGSSWSAS